MTSEANVRSERVLHRGWSGPHPLLSLTECVELETICREMLPRFTSPTDLKSGAQLNFVRNPWFKSMHAYIPVLFDLVNHPRIVERVAALLGRNLLAWGCQFVERHPGQIHRWHVDVEHAEWDGVTVFLGIKNSANASLKFLDESQRYAAMPQNINIKSDADALHYALSMGGNLTISEPPVEPGSFLLFDGRIWHASHNTSDYQRSALVIQYTPYPPSVKIPLNWERNIMWHTYLPPCVHVSGQEMPIGNAILRAPLSLSKPSQH